MWEYSADGDSLKAACNNPEHKEEADGAQSFTATLVKPTEKIYTGSAIKAAVTGATEAEFHEGYSVTYKCGGDSVDEPINAGSYQAILTATDGGASVTVDFEIEPAPLTITGATVTKKTYDGDNTATITEFTFAGYKKDEDNTKEAISVKEYTAAFVSPNAGTSVKVTITSVKLGGTAAGNYAFDPMSEDNAEITGEIEKATANVSITAPQNAKYNDEEQRVEVTISVVGGKTSLGKDDYIIFYQGAVETNKTPLNADTYTVTVALIPSKAGNYTLTGDRTTFTIDKATTTVVWADTDGGVYGSAIKTPTASAAGVGSDELTLKVEIDETSPTKGAFKNAGGYIFVASVVGDLAQNYILQNATSNLVTISKADPAEYADAKYKVENVSDHAAHADAPCMYRIKNERRARYAAELIAVLMSGLKIERAERAAEDYYLPYEQTEPLIERGLIKVVTLTPRAPTADDEPQS